MMAKAARKAPNAVDAHVGSKVRMRRLLVGMSQEKLGNALGLTFQQVQKYEKGTNRIGASRLQQISKILNVPVSFFFDDAPGHSEVPKRTTDMDFINKVMATSEGQALVRAFSKIEDVELKRRLVELVKQMAA